MNNDLWADETKKWVSKEGTLWAKLKIKKDAKTNKQYIDVLIGRKAIRTHAHMGINLDQSIKFKEFRGEIRSIGRKVESTKKGLLADEALLVDPTISPAETFTFKIKIDGNSKEVTIDKFGEMDSE